MEIKERNAASEIRTRKKTESLSRRVVRNMAAQSKGVLDTTLREKDTNEDAVDQIEQASFMVPEELSARGIATAKTFIQNRTNQVQQVERKDLQSKAQDISGSNMSSMNVRSASMKRPKHIRRKKTSRSGKSIQSNPSKINRSLKARWSARRNLMRQTTHQSKSAAGFLQKLGDTAAKTAAAMVRAIAGIAGGGVLLALLAGLVVAGAVLASPFGILFSNESSPDGTPLNAAVAQIQAECGDRLTELQVGEYDDIVLLGRLPEWENVVAVFASKTAGSEDGIDVMTLDEDRVERLREVFWDMTEITAEIRNSESETGTKSVLYLTITTKTADEMRTAYSFTKQQNEMLDELLSEREAMDALLIDLSITQQDALELWKSLPEDLSPERRAVVKAALSLVGKVNYFWGGKSEVIGWNYRWGQLQKVTAAGSVTSGTYRPYGLDCSGFVDWVFYNASGGTYLPSNGGGAAMQHTNCVDIAWKDAQPGDLVFYPNDEHVGIVGGWNENGELLVIHCSSEVDGTAMTSETEFTCAARAKYFVE